MNRQHIRYVLLMAAVLVASGAGRLACADTGYGQTHVLAGDELRNNPLALKILSEIGLFKRHVLQMQQEQNASDASAAQIEHQREVASQLEQDAMNTLEQQNAGHTPHAAFATFVSTINGTTAQNIFWGQFDYMEQKVEAGNAAMKQVLDNGGTWGEAVQEFSKYAAITHDEMVRVNEDLNIQYGAADQAVQSSFYANGTLPDNYITMPDKTTTP